MPLSPSSWTYRQITACRVCGSGKFRHWLNLGNQYLANFVKQRDETLPQAPLEWVRCEDCGLLQLLHSVHPDLLWGETYWYRSSVNETMKAALRDVVTNAIRFYSRIGGIWLDIGANDGYLLSQVPATFRRIACEPAKPFHQNLLAEGNCDRLVSDFFSETVVDEQCDVITSCACFYDLDDPNTFVDGIFHLLRRGGLWVNQLTGTEQMLKKNDFPNICHEHRCFYDLAGLQALYAKHGLKIIHASENDTNGGSIRTIAQRWDEIMPEILPAEPIKDEAIEAFCGRVQKWKSVMTTTLNGLHESGHSIWGYAASTKGVMMLQYLDRSELILAVADRNPKKHGLLMPGSWLPIIDEATMRQAQPDVLLALAWAFRDEFLDREQAIRDLGTTILMPLPNPELVI